ncbi:MAG TPA: cyanophycinase [Noviherbaspirillum sp.]|jgi:cyanophycinase-like exopeptidase|uniref:cyanophycinase n=1 Tax=Noviherbaspirillum sp. TaxID=1926288 RepID=UPI002DDD906E|nr:cyanophycinase [Noviherbaspirillum sp.]HEV2612926.1 cyanophycinase [Noviherbaspirillum sp.]
MFNIATYGTLEKLINTTFSYMTMVVLLLLMPTLADAAKKPGTPATPYTYYSVGNPDMTPSVAQTRPDPSYVLMGGGPDVDEAFRWMIQRAGITPATGGRLVVIRATGDGGYNPYIYYSGRKSSVSNTYQDGWVGGASLGLTSVETLVIPSTAAANDPFVNAVVSRANAVWIAGGDQTDYFRYWKGQALETTLNGLMQKNVPIGGTSAGLAVLGGFDFSGFNGTVTSTQALTDPYNLYMTFDPSPLSTSGGFIAPPVFANMIMDSHLDSRDRMGRLVTFVSRLISLHTMAGTQQLGCTGGVLQNNTARGIGVGVEAALLVQRNSDGSHTGRRVTNVSTTTESAIYFVNVTQGPTVCASGRPLSIPTSAIQIRKLADDTSRINLSDWSAYPVYKSGGVESGSLFPTNPY